MQFDDDTPIPTGLDLQLWRRILTHGLPYRKLFGGMALAGLVVAVADALTPLLTATLIDRAADGASFSELAPWVGAYAVTLGLIAMSVWVFIEFAGRIATGIAHDLREAGFARLQQLSYSFYDTHSVGLLVARVTSDTGKVSGLLPWLMLDFVWGGALMLGITVAMFALHPTLALVVLAVVPPLVLLSILFQRMILTSSRRIRSTNAKITSAFNEAVMGVKTTRSLVREDANHAEFQDLSTTMYGHSMTNAIQSAVYLPVVMGFASIAVGLALWRGGLLVGDSITIGVLVAFMQYAALFAMPIQEIARTFTLMQSAQAAAERVQGLLETVPTIRSSPKAPCGNGVRSVEFSDVRFGYKPEEPVLDGVSFRIGIGETLALVGATGGGKSTIAKLLPRFYDIDEGAILVDGVDIRTLDLAWLQAQFGVVLQSPHLFSGTLLENIRYGRLDATDEEIEAAAELVHASPFISKLKDGYQTEVGEGGAKLSTGQRQLVSLARAVLADPPVFIMDEATSSVDTETEQAIQAGIEAMLAGRISIVIAHRLSTIRRADQILVIDEGRVAESGNHESLTAQRGEYWRLQGIPA